MIRISNPSGENGGGGGGYSTMMTGEEGGGVATTLAVGEEGGGGINNPSTRAIGEEGGGIPTTAAIGEEGGIPDITTLAVGEEGGGGYQPDETMDTFTGITFVQYADSNRDGMMTSRELNNHLNLLTRYQTFLNYSAGNSVYTEALKFFISEQIQAGNFMQKYFAKFDNAGPNPNNTINAGDIYTVAARDGNVREVSANNDNLRNTFVQFPPLVNGLYIQPPQIASTGALYEDAQAVTLAYPETGQAV